jgi:hypothetical protein
MEEEKNEARMNKEPADPFEEMKDEARLKTIMRLMDQVDRHKEKEIESDNWDYDDDRMKEELKVLR